MGFRPPRKIYTLDFTGTDYEGLEVRMRGMTVGEELDHDSRKGENGFAHYMFNLLAELLVDWNVEDDRGQPVPPTFEGVCSQSGDMVSKIIEALRNANSEVSDPLPQTSPTGGPTPVVSIPMAPLSESPESSAVPA